MTVTLVLTQAIDQEIAAAAALSQESGAVLLAKPVFLPSGDLRLLARGLHWVDDESYVVRSRSEMKIRPEGYLPALAVAEADGAVPIWFHTHPARASAGPSDMDLIVDDQLADLFRLRASAPFYGRLIASSDERGWAWTGSLFDEADAEVSIDRLWSVGDRFRLSFPEGGSQGGLSEIYDRNVRAFGEAIQHALSSLVVAIIGSGGTGSAVAEQLVRLGVRHIILVDVDTLSVSNVTRVYGSTPAKVGKPKVEVLRDHLMSIAPDLQCETVPAMVTLRRSAEQLVAADLIFGCTDDNAGRLVLSRLSTYYLVPVIDVGVLLSSAEDGTLTGIDGRVTILSPGSACLVCRNRVDLARASAELMTPEERRRLADEGYAPALGGREPAVVAFTTAVAAAAVNELLERMIGYGPEERPSEVLLRIHEREISTNRAAPRPGHYCDPGAGKLGAGPVEPFLEQVWPDA